MDTTHGSGRAAAVAEQFERAVEQAVAVFSSLRRDQWTLECPGEQRTVAAVARHIAVAIPFEMRAFTAIAAGDAFEPIRWDWLHEVNAEDGASNAEADLADTLVLLRRNATVAARTVRAMTDEQLGRSGVYVEGMPTMTVAKLLQRILVGHVTGHLASIRAAVGEGGA
jgi:hypothetical protein